jgi:hypothetical protein
LERGFRRIEAATVDLQCAGYVSIPGPLHLNNRAVRSLMFVV